MIGGGMAGVLCAAQHISCALETRSSVMYSLTGQDHLQEEAELLHALGFDAMYTTEPQLPLPVADAVIYLDMAQFRPLRILNAMAKGLRIYKHTFVTALAGTTAVTAHNRVHAKKVIVTTHFPFLNRHGGYFPKLYQKCSYVIAYDNAPQAGCQPRTWAAAATSAIMATCCSSAAATIARATEAWDMRPQRPLRAPYFRACRSGTAGRIRTACRSTASPILAATARGRAADGPSMQMIDSNGTRRFDMPDFHVRGDTVRTGGCVFSPAGPRIRLPGVTGNLRYDSRTPLCSDIMGPLAHLPMQCRHGVVSMNHSVHGRVTVDGQTYVIDGGSGDAERTPAARFRRPICGCSTTISPRRAH